MRVRQLTLILFAALLLAACQGAPAASPSPATLPTVASLPTSAAQAQTTATTVPPTATPLPPVSSPEPRAYDTQEAAASNLIPLPGTLVKSATEDVSANVMFDSVALIRTGGIAGKTLTIQIFSDGTLDRDGQKIKLTPAQMKQVNDQLTGLNFFGLQGVFTAPGTQPDVFHYNISVDRGGQARAIDAEDGFIPKEMQALIDLILQLAQTS
jgi:hypothetical protein